jgi:hypothetical protein
MNERVQKLYKFVLDDESELILNDKQIDELYADLESVIKQRAAFQFVINMKELIWVNQTTRTTARPANTSSTPDLRKALQRNDY